MPSSDTTQSAGRSSSRHRPAVTYEGTLDAITCYIRKSWQSPIDDLTRKRAGRVALDLCYGYGRKFTDTFLARTELKDCVNDLKPDISCATMILRQFVDFFCNLDGECIFLARDAHAAAAEYLARTGRGVVVDVSRRFLYDEGVYLTVSRIHYYIRPCGFPTIYLPSLANTRSSSVN